MTARAEPVVPRPPRLLWANLYCLLDSSSGASMSVRAMLYCLAQQGVQVQALQPWLALRAGDVDGGAQLARLHRHGLDDRVPLPGSHHSSGGAGTEPVATDAPSARLLVL